MPRQDKQYRYNGLAGCVTQKHSRATGCLIGIYHSKQSGIEDDPELPWAVVCEAHHTLVCTPTLELARQTRSGLDFCDDCCAIKARKDKPQPEPDLSGEWVSWSVDYRCLKEERGKWRRSLEYRIVTARTMLEASHKVRHDLMLDGRYIPKYPVTIKRWVADEPWSPCGPFCAFEDCGCYFGSERGFGG